MRTSIVLSLITAAAFAPAIVLGQGGFVSTSTTPSLTASASTYPQETVGTTVVVADTANFTTVISGADGGSFVHFTAGIYSFPNGGITISQPLHIRCPSSGCVFKCADVCFTLNGTNWTTVSQTTIDEDKAGDIVFKNNATGAECIQKTPYALNASFQFSVQQPVVKDGNLELPLKFNEWYNSRRLYEVKYGSCAFSNNATANTTLKSFQFQIKSDCSAAATVKVVFDKLKSCIGSDGIVDSFPNIIYSSRVSIEMLENLRHIDPEHALRAPANRRGTTYANVAVSIDSVQNVSSVISATTPLANIEAKVVLVDIGSENGVNESRIVLELDTPQPFTLNGGDLKGPVLFTDNLDSALSTSQYNISKSCTGTAVGPTLLCKQTIVFVATGCDLTASYRIEQLALQCAVGSEVTCPLIEGYVEPVDIDFYIATDNFCNVNEFSISDLFSIDITPYTKSDFFTPTSYSSLALTLGNSLYQKIVFNNSVSGVNVDSAVVIQLTRTSNGPCDATPSYQNYAKNYNDGNGPSGVNQTFDVGGALTNYVNYYSDGTYVSDTISGLAYMMQTNFGARKRREGSVPEVTDEHVLQRRTIAQADCASDCSATNGLGCALEVENGDRMCIASPDVNTSAQCDAMFDPTEGVAYVYWCTAKANFSELSVTQVESVLTTCAGSSKPEVVLANGKNYTCPASNITGTGYYCFYGVDTKVCTFNIEDLAKSVDKWDSINFVTRRSDTTFTSYCQTSNVTCATTFIEMCSNGTLTCPEVAKITRTEQQGVKLAETVSAAMACATANSSSNTISQAYTVRVSYTDGRSQSVSKNNPNGRKRRASVVRRGSGDMDVASNFGISYDPSQLQEFTSADAVPGRTSSVNDVSTPVNSTSNSSMNMYMVIAAMAVLFMLCCCCLCCCVAVGAIVVRRRQQQREKEAAFLAQQSVLGFGPNSSSNVCFTPHQQ